MRHAPNWFEFNEYRTQRSVSHDVIDIPDLMVSERALDDDEQNELRREMAMIAVRNAMKAEEAV